MLWSAVLLAVLKAMGQKAHLWKTWQCRSWMWLFNKAKVRWTTPQWMHLGDRGGGCQTRRWGEKRRDSRQQRGHVGALRSRPRGHAICRPPQAYPESLLACPAPCNHPGPPSVKAQLVEKQGETFPFSHWPEDILLQTKNLSPAKGS